MESVTARVVRHYRQDFEYDRAKLRDAVSEHDILKHRNLKYTEDGGAAPYVHRPDMDYTLDDLAFVPENIETIEIIDDLEE